MFTNQLRDILLSGIKNNVSVLAVYNVRVHAQTVFLVGTGIYENIYMLPSGKECFLYVTCYRFVVASYLG